MGADPDMGGTLAMRETMACDQAMHLAMTAKTLDGDAALRAGLVTAVTDEGVTVATAEGQIQVQRLRAEGGKKVAAAEWAAEVGLEAGARFR